MKRTAQLRLSHLLIVLLMLASLGFPGGVALAAVTGQTSTPEPGVAAPDMSEDMQPFAPVEVAPVAEEVAVPAAMSQEMADFAPERPDLTPPARLADLAAADASKSPIAEDASVTDPAKLEADAQRAADTAAVEANTAFVPGQPPVVDGVPVGPVPLVEAAPGARTGQVGQVPADYLTQGLAPDATAANYRFVRPGYSNTNTCINNWCGTIQYAINQANPGDTIVIFPGAYRETVTVSKNLTLI